MPFSRHRDRVPAPNTRGSSRGVNYLNRSMVFADKVVDTRSTGDGMKADQQTVDRPLQAASFSHYPQVLAENLGRTCSALPPIAHNSVHSDQLSLVACCAQCPHIFVRKNSSRSP
ncbi:hypothetical protein SBBP2_2280005 [Burkholderiales bacterium]|nr:hypothetical protein SBBP2_2280005 [Burkholderiales bacterium]